MPFPFIENIADVLPAIADAHEFYVADKGSYKVINYHVNLVDTFPHCAWNEYHHVAALRRECRGIKFDGKTGNIICRPWNKFFNLGEREETRPNNLPSEYFQTFDKLDGSMIAPFYAEGRMIWGTKLGKTDASYLAHDYAMRRRNYVDFARQCIIDHNHTPIFEWCSPYQRIVINYKEPKLVLTAIRSMISGDYISHDHMVCEAEKFGIHVVKENPGYSTEQIRAMTGIEGFVLVWSNGFRVKIKTDEYCAIHTAKDNINREKNVLKMVLMDKEDDVLPHLTEEDADKVRKYADHVRTRIRNMAEEIYCASRLAWDETGRCRKDYAFWVQSHAPRHWHSFYYHARKRHENESDDVTLFTYIKQHMLAQTVSQTKVDLIRDMIDTTWNYNEQIES